MKLNPTYKINLGPPIFQRVNNDFKPIANLSPFTFGPGQPERYLLTEPNKRIPTGTVELPLNSVFFYGGEPFCVPDWEVPYKILNKIEKAGHPRLIIDKDEGTLESICQYHEANFDYLLFAEIVLPLTDESIQELKAKDNEEINELIELYLTEGLTKDKNLITIYKALLLFKYAIYENLSPSDVVPMAPHGLIFTNTKMSKSYTANKVGHKIDDYTPAALFGFGTADKPVPGQLTGIREPVFFDEIRDKATEGVMTATKSYEESGKFRSWKGGYSIETEAYAPLIYMGNNEQRDKDEALQVAEFAEILNIITDSYEAFGSRKGFIYFTLDGTPKSGKPISDKQDLRELNAAVQTILILLGEKYEDIITRPELEKWIYEPFPDWYTKAVKSSIDEFSYQDKTVKDFWRGTLEAYVHAKLYCINLAILDFSSDFLNDKPPADKELFERCEYHYHELLSMNLESLKTMVGLTVGHEYEIFKHGLDVLTPEYLKHLVKAVHWFLNDKENIPPEMEYSLEEVGRVYQSLDKSFIDSELYSEFRRIKEKIPKNKGTINGILETKHGFKLHKSNGVYFIRIKKPGMIKENLKLFNKYYSVRSGADGCDEKTERTEAHRTAPTQNSKETPKKVYTNSLKSILCGIFGDDSDITRERWHKAKIVISENLSGNRINPEVFQRELSRVDISIPEQEEITKALNIKEVGKWYEVPKEGLEILGVE